MWSHWYQINIEVKHFLDFFFSGKKSKDRLFFKRTALVMRGFPWESLPSSANKSNKQVLALSSLVSTYKKYYSMSFLLNLRFRGEICPKIRSISRRDVSPPQWDIRLSSSDNNEGKILVWISEMKISWFRPQYNFMGSLWHYFKYKF